MMDAESLPIADRPRLLYLTTEYPHVSHTFIRREILGLEKLGYTIKRVAINSGEMIVDSIDTEEEKQTLHILDMAKKSLITHIVRGAYTAKFGVVSGLLEALKMSRASDRGVFKHLAYFLEALILVAVSDSHNIGHTHVHFGTNAATVAHLASIMGGSTYSMTVHGPVEFDQPYGQSLNLKLAAAKFTIAITSYCRSQIYRWAPLSKWDDIHIVGCSVGDDWFNAAQPMDETSSGIVCVGRLDEQKGQLLLINAFADAVDAGFEEDLTIIGDGAFREPIEQCIAERAMQGRVHLVGWQGGEAIQRIVLSAKALVVSSFAEGLPVVIMEAMALQRPIIATRITGIPELVRHEVDGWLVTPGHQGQLTQALIALSQTDLNRLNDMGQQAQERVRLRHASTKIAAKLDLVIQQYC